jgi:hypothetical protein
VVVAAALQQVELATLPQLLVEVVVVPLVDLLLRQQQVQQQRQQQQQGARGSKRPHLQLLQRAQEAVHGAALQQVLQEQQQGRRVQQLRHSNRWVVKLVRNNRHRWVPTPAQLLVHKGQQY